MACVLAAAQGVLDEKAAATQALGVYAKHAGPGFAPLVEPVLAALLRMAAYFHDDVREQAYEALSFLALATHQAFPAPTPGARRRPSDEPCTKNKLKCSLPSGGEAAAACNSQTSALAST